MSLYDNEVVDVKRWDPITGSDYQDFRNVQEEEAIKTLIEEGKTFENFKKSDGWKLLEEFLENSLNEYKEKIVFLTDFEKIKRLQEAIKAYQNVTAYVDYKILEGQSFETNKAPEKG